MSGGVSTTTLPEPEAPLVARMAHIPLDADVVVSLESASLLQLSQTAWMLDLDQGFSRASVASPLALCDASRDALGVSLCQPSELHEALRLDLDGPLHIARSASHWIFVFDHASRSPAPTSLEAWSSRLEPLGLQVEPLADAATSPFEVTSLRLRDRSDNPDAPMARWLRSRSRSILVIPTPRTSPESGAALARALSTLEPARAWRSRASHRSLQDAMTRAGSEVSVVLRAELLTAALTPRNDAARAQRDALSRQLDLVGLSLSRSSPAGAHRIQGQLFVSSTEQEPIFLDALDPASSPLDTELGVLLGPRARGIFHLAASPHSLLETLKGALDFEQRQQLDEYFVYLKDELLLDVEQAIFENLTGHFLLIIYEQDPDARRASSPAPDPFGLSTTREALYMPLRDSFAMEQFLNALTQITRGRMRRQRVDEIIQYVLLDDGELQGAFLLGKDALLWVDSSVAVEQGMRHLNSPRALSDKQSKRFGDLLKGRQGFGMWFEPGRYLEDVEKEEEQDASSLVRALSGVEDFRLTSYAFMRAPEGEERPSAPSASSSASHESASFSFSLVEPSPEKPLSPEP